MSKRFGRNQRRQLRETIANLNATIDAVTATSQQEIAKRDHAIAVLRAGDWMPAEGKGTLLTDLVIAITAQSITEGVDRRGRWYRRASLLAVLGGNGLADLLWGIDRGGLTMSRRNPVVEWNGAVWCITNCIHSRHDHLLGQFEIMEQVVEVELEALPPKTRSAVRYRYGREKTVQRHLRTVDGSTFHTMDPRPVVQIG